MYDLIKYFTYFLTRYLIPDNNIYVILGNERNTQYPAKVVRN